MRTVVARRNPNQTRPVRASSLPPPLSGLFWSSSCAVSHSHLRTAVLVMSPLSFSHSEIFFLYMCRRCLYHAVISHTLLLVDGVVIFNVMLIQIVFVCPCVCL